MSITTHISGGLGNQLFQYATGRALSLSRDTDLYLDTSSFTESGNLRSCILDHYQIKSRILRKKNWLHQKISDVLRSSLGISTEGKVYGENLNTFDANVLKLSNGTYLLGHWQSQKYFLHHGATIKQDLTLQTPLSQASIEILRIIKKGTSVAVHVRRGDYVSNSVAQQVLGTQTPSYYERAANYLGRQVKNAHYYVFSDDPKWASLNILTGYKSVTYLPTSMEPYEDLELMRACDHFITANSSFSWWGAWLGSKKGSIVISPKKWFASPEYSSKDLIPNHWVQI